MKLKIEFGFGAQFRGDGSAILGHEQVAGIARIATRATDLFGGHTLMHTLGEWKDPDTNEVVAEEGCVISVLTGHNQNNVDGRVDQMVQQIKDSLQQKAVAVTRTEVHFDIL